MITANNLMRAEHSSFPPVRWSLPEAYAFARLLQLGSADGLRSNAYGAEAVRHARHLSAEVVAEADRHATTLFRSRFASRTISEKESYENCGN